MINSGLNYQNQKKIELNSYIKIRTNYKVNTTVNGEYKCKQTKNN